MRLDAGTIVGRKYRLERLIASGGMGAVWQARHEQLGVPVAVKLISSVLAADPAARARFEREARAAAQLRSPHVVQVLDYGAEDDLPYMAMEMLHGEDLAAHLARTGRLSLRRTARILGDVARAIALAHEAGIVHRDLKPRNVFLARVGDEEVIKVCDFGIAKELRPGEIAARDETATGTLLGSPHYMSPEQARGGRVDQRSDLWSMGVLAFEAVTGRRPFVGENMGDVIVRICTDPVPVASKLVGSLPAEIDAFFVRALSREPADRFASARELAAALSAIAAQTPEDSASSDALAMAEPSEAPTVEARAEAARVAVGTRSVAGRIDATQSLPGAQSSDTLHAAVVAAEHQGAAWRRAQRSKAIVRVVAGTALAIPLLGLLWQRVVAGVDAGQPASPRAAVAASSSAVEAPAPSALPEEAAAAPDAPGVAPPAAPGDGASSATAPGASTAPIGKGTAPRGGGARPAAAAARPSFDPFSGLPVNKPAASSRARD